MKFLLYKAWRKTVLIWRLILFFPDWAFSQYTNKQIDSLLRGSFITYRKPGNFEGALNLYLTMLKASKRNKYENGIAWSHMHISNMYTVFGKYVESFQYADSASFAANKLGDKSLEVLAASELGKVYILLGYFDQALKICHSAISIAKELEESPEKAQRIQYLYSTLAVVHDKKRQPQLFLEALKKGHQAYPNPFLASRIAKYFLEYEIVPDSARKYLDEAGRLWNTGKFGAHQKSIMLRCEGRYYFAIKDIPNAVKFYRQSILISKKLRNIEEEATTYKLLFDAYKSLNDSLSAASALEVYTALSDSLASQKVKAVEIPASRWLESQNRKHRIRILRLYVLIAVITVFSAWLLYKGYFRAKAKGLPKENALKEFSEEEIFDGMKDQYHHLYQLAANNDPAFYFALQETFPGFESKLFAIDRGLRASELLLLGYIFLGLNTKQIAEYTHKSVRTIENRKYQIRKKMGIPSNEDMALWLRKFISMNV